MRVLLVCVLLSSVAQEACAAAINKNIPGEDAGLALLMGQGLNTVDWTAKGYCVDLGKLQTQSNQHTGQYAEFRMLEITSESALRENLNISAAGMLKSTVFFKIDGRLRFARSVNKNRSSRYLLVHVRVANQMELASSFTFRQSAIDLLKNGEKEAFVEFCGNEFVYGRRTGGELFALFEFEFNSEQHERRFDAAIRASGLMWRAAADIENEVDAFSELGSTQIKIYRLGGQGKFPEIKNLVDFGREFSSIVSVLGKEFVTLELVTKDYSGVEPVKLVKAAKMLLKQDQIVRQLAVNNDYAVEMLNTITYIKSNANRFERVDHAYLDARELEVRKFLNLNNAHVIACFEDVFNGCRLPEQTLPTFVVPRKKSVSASRCAENFSWSAEQQACCQQLHRVFCELRNWMGACVLNRIELATQCQGE